MNSKFRKVKFTAGRVNEFACEPNKTQAFLWDSAAPGLGVRATANGAKTYVFQSKLDGETVRVTIGDVRAWSIPKAEDEARRLKVLIDSKQDPRKLRTEAAARERALREAEAAAAEAKRERELREALTVGDVWPEYVADRIATRENGWSQHHIDAHRKLIQSAGLPRKRSSKLTTAGPLFSLANVRLIDLTSERIEAWAKEESKRRQSTARLAWRLLKAFLNWCAAQKAYAELVQPKAVSSSRTRESLGKQKRRNDVLQLRALSEALRFFQSGHRRKLPQATSTS